MTVTRDEIRAAVAAEANAFAARVVDLVLAAQVAPSPPVPPIPPAGSCIDADGLKRFFDAARAAPPLGPGLSPGEVEGCQRILLACSAARWPLAWASYALATAYHETAGTMQPIREIGRGKGKAYGKPGKHAGQAAYGRGYVQLTWDYNYEAADAALGLGGALLANYDLALVPEVAARVLVFGLESGLFNGSGRKGLAAYLPAVADVHQFTNARRTVNVLDDAVQIAGYALAFQADLQPSWGC